MNFIRNIGGIFIFPGFLFSIFIGFLLLGYDRKIVARMQRRKGPKLNIAFMDFIKLIGKDTIIPRNCNETLFLLAPIISLTCISIIPSFIPIMNLSLINGNVNIIVIILLLLVPIISILLGTISSSSPFAAIGSSRLLTKVMSYEVPLILIILAVVKKATIILDGNKSYSLLKVVQAQENLGNFMFKIDLIPAVIAFLIILPSIIGTKSFEIAEADTEIAGGIYAEYSGLHLGLYKIVDGIKGYVMIILFLTLFLGNIWIKTKLFYINFIINIFILLILVLIIYTIVLSIVRSIIARYDNEIVVKFYLIVPTMLSIVSYVLVSLKL